MKDTTAELFPNDGISSQEWAWVRNLIEDVQRQEMCDAFAKNLWQWDFVVKQFRKVELERILLGSPNEKDRLYHAMCLNALLALGKFLLAESIKLKAEELLTLGVTREQIAAYVAELEQSYREWYHGISESELKTAREKVFGGPA